MMKIIQIKNLSLWILTQHFTMGLILHFSPKLIYERVFLLISLILINMVSSAQCAREGPSVPWAVPGKKKLRPGMVHGQGMHRPWVLSACCASQAVHRPARGPNNFFYLYLIIICLMTLIFS